MAVAFKLPDLGEGIHEGEVLAVRVSVGQEVKEGDIILEIETDKAAVEIPSPFTGTVEEILVKPGDIVTVGSVLMMFSNDEREPAAEENVPEEPPAPEPMPESGSAARGPVPASPSTRRLARELGVDLRQVPPSGPAGLVTAEDVRAFKDKGAAPAQVEPLSRPPTAGVRVPQEALPPLPDFTRWGEIERIPFRSVRRATARQMSLAWSQIPHVTSQETADVTKLEAFRRKHKDGIAALGGKLTLTVFTLKAVATALKTFPQFNATLDVEHREIIQKRYFHIGLAVNTEKGLIVPVVRDVDRKSIRELAVEVNAIVQRTRQGKTKLEELQGGTFTITNAGAMGGGFFTPIINYPEVAILGMGQARLQPVVRTTEGGESEVVVRRMMPLVLCIDHRVLDGADAIAFLQLVAGTLEDPDELLMAMT